MMSNNPTDYSQVPLEVRRTHAYTDHEQHGYVSGVCVQYQCRDCPAAHEYRYYMDDGEEVTERTILHSAAAHPCQPA